MSRLACAVALLAACAVGGCYDVPMPNCGFSCEYGAANRDEPQCPSGYLCSTDNRCRRSSPPFLDECNGGGGQGIDLTPPDVDITLFDPMPDAVGATVTDLTFGFTEEVIVRSDQVVLRELDTGTRLEGTVSGGIGQAFQFFPLAPIRPSTSYEVTLDSGIEDVAGNRMLVPFTYEFSTGVDAIAPRVQVAMQGNSVHPTIDVQFSEYVTGLTTGSFDVRQGGRSYEYSLDLYLPQHAAQLTLLEQLAPSSDFTVMVDGGIVDLGGNQLTGTTTYTFTTGADLEGPRFLRTFPMHDASAGVDVDIQVTFDEDVVGVDDMTIVVTRGSEPIDTVVTYDAVLHRATIAPVRQLEQFQRYMVQVTGVRDAYGNGFASFPANFSFDATNDVVRPRVIGTLPAVNATNVLVGNPIYVEFDERVTNVTSATFTVSGATGAIATTNGGYTWRFTPDAPLPAGTTVTVTLGTGVRDESNNALATPFTFSFTTAP